MSPQECFSPNLALPNNGRDNLSDNQWFSGKAVRETYLKSHLVHFQLPERVEEVSALLPGMSGGTFPVRQTFSKSISSFFQVFACCHHKQEVGALEEIHKILVEKRLRITLFKPIYLLFFKIPPPPYLQKTVRLLVKGEASFLLPFDVTVLLNFPYKKPFFSLP